MFNFLDDWKKAERDLFTDQKKRFENEPQILNKLNELNMEYEALQDIVEELSEEQKDAMINIPRTKEEWEAFNEMGNDIVKKEEKLLELFDEISRVIDKLPLSGEDFNKRWKELAMEIMKKHNLNN